MLNQIQYLNNMIHMSSSYVRSLRLAWATLNIFRGHIMRLVQLCCVLLLFSIQHIHCMVVLFSILVTLSLLLVFCASRSIMYSEHSFLWPPEKVISVGVGQKKVTRHSLIITVTINATFAITFNIWGALEAISLASK